MHVDIYTDGAARGNPGPGGYGTVLRFVDSKGAVHEKELSQGYERTTNNRMELMAVVAGLEVLKRPCSITLYSDSQYVVNAFNQHWVDGWLKRGWKNAQKQPVKNDDLWKRLLAAKEPHDVTFVWVKGMRAIPRTSAATSWPRRPPTARGAFATRASTDKRGFRSCTRLTRGSYDVPVRFPSCFVGEPCDLIH